MSIDINAFYIFPNNISELLSHDQLPLSIIIPAIVPRLPFCARCENNTSLLQQVLSLKWLTNWLKF